MGFVIDLLVIIITLVVGASPALIYWDATRNRIGKAPGEHPFPNFSAGLWATATLLLWIIAVPAYFYYREALIARAGKHPVEVKDWIGKLLVFITLGLVFLGISCLQMFMSLAMQGASVY